MSERRLDGIGMTGERLALLEPRFSNLIDSSFE